MESLTTCTLLIKMFPACSPELKLSYSGQPCQQISKMLLWNMDSATEMLFLKQNCHLVSLRYLLYHLRWSMEITFNSVENTFWSLATGYLDGLKSQASNLAAAHRVLKAYMWCTETYFRNRCVPIEVSSDGSWLIYFVLWKMGCPASIILSILSSV